MAKFISVIDRWGDKHLINVEQIASAKEWYYLKDKTNERVNIVTIHMVGNCDIELADTNINETRILLS